MKSFVKLLLATTAAILIAAPAHAQTIDQPSFSNPSPYGQIDLGGALPSGGLGNQLVIGARGGVEFNKWFAADLSLSQGFMMPATWLGGMNSTEFKLTPYLQLPLTDRVKFVAGPQIGVALLSGPASTNSMVGTYGGTAAFVFDTGWNRLQIVPQYEYTRSMTPGVITGPGYTDYYNNSKFTMGLRKQF